MPEAVPEPVPGAGSPDEEATSAARAAGVPRAPLIVALDGRSGAGKTRLAARVVAALLRAGRSCTVVHLDDLYPGWSGLAAALPVLCRDVLGPLREGRPGRFTAWDWHADAPGAVVEVPVADVLLVEGVGAGAAPCRRAEDLVVWLDAPEDVRRQRALRRDGETFAPHWAAWAEQEEELFARRGGPARATVVVKAQDEPTSEQLDALLTLVDEALASSPQGTLGP